MEQKKIIPHTDLATEKIYGCEPGTWKWYHEEGHILYNKQPKSSQLKLIQQYIFTIWMFTCTLSVMNKYMFFLSLPAMLGYIGIDVYEEQWCNHYADNKVRNETFKN